MSIKSQKSLNDECSEIFEKSYSVRSLSQESLSSEGDESLSRELLQKLSPAMLSKLRRRFKRNKKKLAANSIDRKVEEVMREAAIQEGVEFEARATQPSDSLWLDEDNFVAAIDSIFGHHKYNSHARQLYLALDPLRRGRLHWCSLLAKLMPNIRPTHTPAHCYKPMQLKHCQRECIVKLVSIEGENTFSYMAVSKGGRVGVYSGLFQLLNSYEVFHHRTGARRRVKNCWITDAVYMSDAACVAFATSERCLRVFAAPTPAHALLYCVTGLPDLPTCLAYSPSGATCTSSSLLVGTVRGTLCALRFARPRVALLQHYCCWTELCAGAQRLYCSARVLPSHSRAVRRVACEQGARRVLSCSHEADGSLRVRHSCPHLDDYVFKVQRGVSCFHAVMALQLVATGSSDGAVRLWELTQTSPFACLAAPAPAPVLDVVLMPHLEAVVAFHKNCTLNIWDMHEECLLQSIKIKFPFLGVLGKKLEFGTYCIHPGPARRKATTDDIGEQTCTSRRNSQVYRGSTGGLLLEEDNDAADGLSRDVKRDPWVSEALIKRLGANAFPFHLELTPLAPPSVQLVPAKQYHGAPIGTSYDVRAYIAERADEKISRRNTVRMGIRVLQGPGQPIPPVLPNSPHHTLSALAHHNVLRLKNKTKHDADESCRGRKHENENVEQAPPRATVEKPFLLSDGRVELEGWLDKATYSHGESINVSILIANHSSKTVRRIKVLVIQHVDVCMFSNGKFKNVVALVRGTGTPVMPDQTLTDTYTLTPHRGVTKNWIALEDSYSKSGASLASTVLCNSNSPEDRNVFAIYVSYYVKVKLSISAMGGDLSLKLPFTLTHSCINEAPTDSVTEEATHKMILEGKENSEEEDSKAESEKDKQNNNEQENINQERAFGDNAEIQTPDDHRCVADVLVNIENKINDRPKKFEGQTEVRNVKPNEDELDLIVKYPCSDT